VPSGRMSAVGAKPAAAASSFAPLTDISWYAAYWASDPDWTAPADGGALDSGWRDGSGNARTITATGGNRPLYRATTTALNNKPSVEFDGVNDYLKLGSLSQAVPLSLVAIFQYVSNTASGGFGRVMDCKTSTYLTIYNNGATGAWGNLSLYAGSAAISSGVTASTTGQLMYGVVTSGTDTVGAAASSATGAAGNNALDCITLGANPALGASANYANVSIAFAAVYAGDITAHANWSAFRTWANSFYGVTV
jgi:hypothetical protein